MENEVKLKEIVVAESNAAGTEEDPIITRIRSKFTDSNGKVHIALLETQSSCIYDKDGNRLDRVIKELQDAVGAGDKPIVETIHAEIDKKVGNLENLSTEDKANVVSSINELKQVLNKKWQFYPKAVETTQNPETFQTGYVYSVEGELSVENGHPYNAGWDHITYLIYGDAYESGEGYRNIIAINHKGNTYVKSQGWNVWNKWKQVVDTGILPELVSNKNLLINPDFTHPINQRNETYYVGNYNYTIDRWYQTEGTVYVRDGYIELYRTGNVNFFEQKVDLDLAGKIVTFSVCTIDNKIYSNTQYISDMDYTYGFTNVEEYKIRMAYNAINKVLTTQIYCDDRNDSAILKLKWAKLEVGSIATQFIPPNPAEELLKCYRYYYQLDFPIYYSDMQFGFRLPVKMREIPTVDLKTDSGKIVVYSHNETSAVLAYMDSGAWNFVPSTSQYLKFDAEVY